MHTVTFQLYILLINFKFVILCASEISLYIEIEEKVNKANRIHYTEVFINTIK